MSRCVTEPGYCATELADDQYRGLLVIVCVPLLLAFLSPIVASLFSSERACRAGGSCCHGDDDRPAWVRFCDVRQLRNWQPAAWLQP